jgi:signal transduction histidine kinase
MSETATLDFSLLEALPIGVAVYDADLRVVLVNPAYCASLGMPAGSFPPGTPLVDIIRTAAYRGLYGPGDPEAQIHAHLNIDRSRSTRLRRRQLAGQIHELLVTPLPDGGQVVCAIEVTAILSTRQDAETALSRVTAAVSSLRLGIAAFGPDRTLLLSNPRFMELLGLPHGEVAAGMSFTALLQQLMASDEFHGAMGAAFVAEQRDLDRTRPATARWVRGDGLVIDIASDPLPEGGWTMTANDVSALVGAEDEARRRAQMLDSILDRIPHGICVYGPDRRVSMFNRAYTEIMSGVPLTVGDHLEDIIRHRAARGEYGPGNPEAIYEREMQRFITGPQVRRRVRPNGTTIDVRTAPLPDGGHMSAVTDVTPLMQAERVAARRATDMEVMLGSMRHGIMLWDAKGKLVAANEKAAELLGHPPGVLVPGRTRSDVMDSMRAQGELGTGPESEERYSQTLRRDFTKSHERLIPLRNGRVLEARSDPTADGGVVSTFTDVTAARSAEDELQRAKAAAEAANEAKSRFLTTMSHELRTPLNAVIGFSDALLAADGGPTPEQVSEFAKAINDAGRQLLGQINTILDISRIDTGRFELTTDVVDPMHLIQTCIDRTVPRAEAGQIALRTELPPDLPRLHADRRRLEQVLDQLLSNAMKFTPAGGTVTLRAEAEPDGDLLIRVVDTGIGIVETDLERVFEPFSQLDSTLSRRFKGAGLGLYLSRTLIEGHGGRLSLSSRLGAGTTAEIRMPRTRLAPLDVESPGAEPKETT